MAQESFRRWQTESIKQKQTASALLLGLSGAAVAFAIAQLAGKSAYVGCWSSVAFHLAAAAHLISMASGIAFSLNRVRDFDLTSQIARLRESDPKSTRLTGMCARVRFWGRITRRLVVAQVVFFGLGMLFLLWFVLLHYRNALYPATNA